MFFPTKLNPQVRSRAKKSLAVEISSRFFPTKAPGQQRPTFFSSAFRTASEPRSGRSWRTSRRRPRSSPRSSRRAVERASRVERRGGGFLALLEWWARRFSQLPVFTDAFLGGSTHLLWWGLPTFWGGLPTFWGDYHFFCGRVPFSEWPLGGAPVSHSKPRSPSQVPFLTQLFFWGGFPTKIDILNKVGASLF